MAMDLDAMRLPIEVGGLTFRNPFYVGSGPASKSVDQLVKADRLGWGGASIKLTFDPTPYVSLEPRYGYWADRGFLSFSAETRLSKEEGLRLIEEGRRRCSPDFVLLANITYIGDKPGVQGWVDMAKEFEAAGAHAIELNMCCPNMSYNVTVSSTTRTQHQTGASLGQNPEAVSHITGEVRKAISIPLFVKLTPEGGRIADVAKACFEKGADAVGGTANRLGVPPIDIYNPRSAPYALQKEPSMSCLCGPWLRPLAFRDVYEIRKLVGKRPRLTCAGGIMTLEDVVTAALCGADFFVICTGILLKGFELLPPLMKELKAYMQQMGYARIEDFRDILVQEITPATKLTVLKGRARKIDDHLRGPCQVACPFNVPAQDYVTLVAEGDFRRAYDFIASKNPLQSVCGWVCNHPCESECTRALKDEPIRIRDIKRFVVERAAAEGWKPRVEKAMPKARRVAVIGSGPAGLSAAYHLARAGYSTTVFDSAEKPGGMLRYAIPRFRLPESVVDSEIEIVREVGAEFVMGKALGRDFALADLREQGYEAIVLAIGASVGLPLGIPGEDPQGSPSAVDFLRQVSEGKRPRIGRRVAIVGGGFTAMDAARTAVRLGAEEVFVLYRRTRPEMPATSEEVDDAEAEGVKIMYLVAPKEILREEGRIVGLRMVNYVLGETDESGRRRPEEVEGTEFTLRVDTVISAVSQALGGADRLGVATRRGRAIEADERGLTSEMGVFAAGDAVTGPDNVIAAVAGGYNAAVSADRFLSGDEAFLKPNPKLNPSDKEMVLLRTRDVPRRNRVAVRMREAAQRRGDFAPFVEAMSEAEAVAEAARCLRCGCSVTCGLCERICSSFAVSLNDENVYAIDSEKCHACGMCVQLCPNRNIEMVRE